MLLIEQRSWNWPMLAVMAFCALSLTGATEGGRTEQPWPALLSNEPIEIDPGVARLQLRANVTLARLMEADNTAE